MIDPGKEFLEKTKCSSLSESAQSKGLPCPPLETPQPDAQLIDLPSPDHLKIGDVDIKQLITQRRSRRQFSGKQLGIEQLTWLLWAITGVKQQNKNTTLRTVPSAGARHPFDIYLAINNVASLKPGLYRYLALDHKLAVIRESSDINAAVTEACLQQNWILSSNATIFWVAVPYRAEWRYVERAWRYMFLDAGHSCQNLYLSCEAIGAGTCAVAAYDDDAVNKLLELDGEERFAIYVAPLGVQ